MNGVLVVDKPAGMTSHDVVARCRRLLRERAIGHLGTLDPMATGVLPLVVGRMTRLAQFYLGAEKEYEGAIRFGITTDTYDADGDPVGEPRPVNLSIEGVREAASAFRGKIRQVPPPFSAKKIQGVPAYKLARKNKPVEIAPVDVEVMEFEITRLESDQAWFRARVSAGTYVRSIAHELGAALGVGGHLAALRRTRVGEFTTEEAHALEAVAGAANQGAATELFIHPRRILPGMPSVTANDESLGKVLHGNAVNLPEMSRARLVKVFRGQTELVAIASRVAGTLFQPKIVLGGE